MRISISEERKKWIKDHRKQIISGGIIMILGGILLHRRNTLKAQNNKLEYLVNLGNCAQQNQYDINVLYKAISTNQKEIDDINSALKKHNIAVKESK